jgi:hypothetical protein
MSRFTCLMATLVLAGAAGSALGQELTPPAPPAAPPPATAPTPAPPLAAPAPLATPAPSSAPSSALRPADTGVQVSTLAAPDAFTTPGRSTGLPPTLWRGTSLKTAGTVLPLLATKPLSPAAAALARRVLATGAPGPTGVGEDAALTAARASALMAQGDPKGAAAILSRAPGIDRNPDLAHAAAESALLAGDDARACAVSDSLSAGRDEIYWLRLRAYCQAVAGHADQAQLTFELAQTQQRDVVYGRLMGVKIAGSGNPGAASLRNGLDYALSRSLGLDLSTAKASPAVAAALAAAEPEEPTFDATAAQADVAGLVDALTKGQPVDDALISALLATAGATDPKVRARGQAAALLAFALSGPLTIDTRGQIAALTLPEGKAPVGRDLALASATEHKLMGESALLALWTSAEAGPAGPVLGDRVRIVRALHAAGLETDARDFALEGLLALK